MMRTSLVAYSTDPAVLLQWTVAQIPCCFDPLSVIAHGTRVLPEAGMHVCPLTESNCLN